MKSIVPREVMRGQENWLKRIIKNNHTLYSAVYKLTRCNYPLYVLKNLRMDTDKLFNNIAIETVSVCNRRCPFCPMSKDSGPKGLMPEKLFDKILKELKELNFKDRVAFSNYGEPLLDTRLPRFVKKVRDELDPAIIWVSTNGDFLTSKKFRELVTAGMTVFHVAQHDAEPSEAVKELFSVITRDEWKYISYEVVGENTVTLNNRAGSVDVETFYPFNCAPQYLIVRWNGEVCMCCNDYYNEVKLGNINDEKLIDVWNKPFYRKIRDDIKRGKFNLDTCRRCLGIKSMKK